MKIHADLHIHTVLSPCGDLEMSPVNIICTAQKKGLQLIGITDHNSTRQALIIRDYGRSKGIFVLTGTEITTEEEAHCLAFFPNDERLAEFQAYLDIHLPFIPNNPEKFGYQVVADTSEQIVYEEKKLLLTALDQNIGQVEKKVHELQGIFIPAHIDKTRFSILSQLGFIPTDLHCDALEISSHTTYTKFLSEHPELETAAFIQSSDAHYLPDIGRVSTSLVLENLTFENIGQAIRKIKFNL